MIGFLKRQFLYVTLGRVDLVFRDSFFRDARVGIRGAKLNSRVVSIGVSSKKIRTPIFRDRAPECWSKLDHWRSFDSRNNDAAVLAAVL